MTIAMNESALPEPSWFYRKQWTSPHDAHVAWVTGVEDLADQVAELKIIIQGLEKIPLPLWAAQHGHPTDPATLRKIMVELTKMDRQRFSRILLNTEAHALFWTPSADAAASKARRLHRPQPGQIEIPYDEVA